MKVDKFIPDTNGPADRHVPVRCRKICPLQCNNIRHTAGKSRRPSPYLYSLRTISYKILMAASLKASALNFRNKKSSLAVSNMAKTEHYYTRFKSGGTYHIYNRTVDRQPMFRTKANYQYFLDRIKKYMVEVVDVFAYNLLGNHFHLLIRVKNIPGSKVHQRISNAFKKMFQSYTLAFNKQQGRIGTLFQTPFKRALVQSEQYFNYLVWYIHANPQLHNLVKDFREWPHGSYHAILSTKPTLLLREQLLNNFGGRDSFIEFHSIMHEKHMDNSMSDE